MAMVKAVVIAVAALAALAQLAAAATVHPVGGDGQWDTSGNYNAWSAAQKFVQGDSIKFTYPPSHDVMEVSKAGYDACSPSSPVASYTGGSTTVKLTTSGKRYFICGVPGHCTAGMKLEVNVAAAAAAKPRGQRSVAPVSAPAPAPAASTDELPTVSSPTGAAQAPNASGAAASIGAKAAVALAMGMAVALAM